jgi:hypothetical protein
MCIHLTKDNGGSILLVCAPFISNYRMFFNFSICNAFTMYVDIAYVYMHSKSYIISKKLINVLQFRTKGVYPTYDTRSNTVVLNTSNNLCYPLFVKKKLAIHSQKSNLVVLCANVFHIIQWQVVIIQNACLKWHVVEQFREREWSTIVSHHICLSNI